MTDIDKILDEVERLHAEASTGWFSWFTEVAGWTVQRPAGFVLVSSDRGGESACKLAASFRTAAPALAEEVRRLRAKLVEAACELAMGRYEKPFKSSEAITREVFEDYSIRLKFEDGKFTEDTK